MTPEITIDRQRASIRFHRFDVDAYALFLRTKQLPESQIAYDWQTDAYTLTTPARFARLLGLTDALPAHADLPLAPHLFDYQQFILRQALAAKRFAAWCDTGLGKTAIFLEFARQVLARTFSRVLILSPLQIIEQTRQEAQKFYGETLPVEHINTRDQLVTWCTAAGPVLGICNYDKMIPGQIPELRYLSGLILDESSLLKSGGGVIKWNLIHSAKGIEYKLSCTATPAPNDTMEYASQASFLEKLRTEGEIIWTFFVRDKYGVWKVKPHARAAFYRFLSTWSIYLRNPQHYGWEDILATLPPPEIREYRVPITQAQRDLTNKLYIQRGAGLLGIEKMGVKERSTLSQLAKGFHYEGVGTDKQVHRIASQKPTVVADLIQQEVTSGRQVLVWTVFDAESAILAELLAPAPFSVATLHGDMPQHERLGVIADYKAGRIRVLVSKPVLLGLGLNFQHVRAMIFSGFDDSFERMYQAIRRACRFGQTETVHVHVPYIPELEGMIFENIKRKQTRFDRDTAIQEQYYREALQGDLDERRTHME